MAAFGIDTGTANNRLVRLDGATLSVIGSLRSIPKGLLAAAAGWTPSAWTQLATEVADEIVQGGYFPLGIDAALSVAVKGRCRYWEAIAGGFHTPDCLNPLPLGGSFQQQNWVRMARLWTETAHSLVTHHGFALWDGASAQNKDRLLVEVYPRMSWIALAAFQSVPIRGDWKQVGPRDSILQSLAMSWNSRPNMHDRDAAVCAITVQRVLAGQTGFFGEPLQQTTFAAFSGGGIAIPK